MPVARPEVPITELFKALSEPTRWEIVQQMGAADELACTTLENTLDVSKSTISYHIKTLYHAGLVSIRKEGRYYFYTLQRDVLEDALEQVRAGVTPPVRRARKARTARAA